MLFYLHPPIRTHTNMLYLLTLLFILFYFQSKQPLLTHHIYTIDKINLEQCHLIVRS